VNDRPSDAALAAVPRVLPVPGPAVMLTNFAADGLELTLAFWIGDLENGQGNVRSDVNLAVLRLLEAEGVEIPFPQRVVLHRNDALAGDRGAADAA
jgi:small-conductance mechanosensitive channel